MLPSKTIPEVGGNGHTRTLKAMTKSRTTTVPPTKKPKACSVGVDEDKGDDEDSPCNITTSTLMNASLSSTGSFNKLNLKKVRSLICHAQYHSNQCSERQKYEKESDLSVLQSCHKWVRRFSRRHRRRSLSLFSWRSQGLYNQKVYEE